MNLLSGLGSFVLPECRSQRVHFWRPFHLDVFRELHLISASEILCFGVHVTYELELAFIPIWLELCRSFYGSAANCKVNPGKRARVSKSVASKAKLPYVARAWKHHHHLLKVE